MATAARRAGALVTSGRFTTLPGAAELGREIKGHAVTVRTPKEGGHTRVMAGVQGLGADTRNPTRVHDPTCRATRPGRSRDQHDVGGAGDVDEIRPTVTTNAAGEGTGTPSHAHRARPGAPSIVIHHPASTAIRLARSDLTRGGGRERAVGIAGRPRHFGGAE